MHIYQRSIQSLTDAANVPAKCAHAYDSFILENASSVSQIESALRSLTYIIPGRFKDAELASESRQCLCIPTFPNLTPSVHSGVQLLSLYHDSLLSRTVARLPRAAQPSASPHNRYTSYWTNVSRAYRRVATLLQMLQYTELLIEMAAKRRGEKLRWRVVVMLECVKAICRFVLVRLTGSRPLLSPPLPQREVDPSTLDLKAQTTDMSATIDETEKSWTMPRTGLPLPVLPSADDIPAYLLTKVLTADAIKAPKTLLNSISGNAELAEVLHILRPVVYALAMQRWASVDKKSWKPWMMGILLEYGARQLSKRNMQSGRAGGLRGMSVLEKEEMQKRGWNMGWWVMRGAFYQNYTRYVGSLTMRLAFADVYSHWIHAVSRRLKDKPVLDLVGGFIQDYELLWDEYYFSTATS